MAPRDSSPRAGDHRRPHDTRRDHNPRDIRPRRDRSTSRDRNPRGPRRGGGDDFPPHRDHHTTSRPNRSRSPARTPRDTTRQRSPPRQPHRSNRGGGGATAPRDSHKVARSEDVAMASAPDDEDEEAAMKRLMGFSGFKSTKNTKVPGNDRLYGVRKDKQTQYRQYMNRVGGFNRPLSPTRI